MKAAVDATAIAKVPEYLSDEEAACVPLTALTALQAFELMHPKAGETVFISGGTGSLVSLRGLPNGEFAVRSGMSFLKRMMFKMAGRKYDKMAAAKGQKYFFIFVHEDGAGLERTSEIFKDTPLEASVDEVFSLDDVNKAMKKVASGGSKGKTILKIL
ncbi:MAG: zinc-binding dehydrogenase [Blautia sp.]|nr:zinc-binding dehydrogenase [Blautia sp.]